MPLELPSRSQEGAPCLPSRLGEGLGQGLSPCTSLAAMPATNPSRKRDGDA